MIGLLPAGWFSHLDAQKWGEIAIALKDTLVMLGLAFPLTLAVGIPLGLVLFLTGRQQPGARPVLNAVVAFVVNVLRSVPFILLMICLIPITLWVAGTSLGVKGAILPLVVGAAPFYARLVESALSEVDRGVLEASQAMGATTRQLILRVLLPEALPGLIAGATVTAIALIGFTAMGGAIGSGGLGDLAYREGYLRSHTDVAVVTVVLLVAMVQLVQVAGERLAACFNHR
nr:methionine ABC transporter permease [Pseudoxanthomonas winnipegensis]